jgi:hypothetical protein
VRIRSVRLCTSHMCVCGIFSKSRNENVCKTCKRSVKRKQTVKFIGFEPYMCFTKELLPELAQLIYKILLSLSINTH